MWGKKIVLALALISIVPLQAMADEPKKIQDNSFLLEEAYNQEAGVVQHIQSFMYLKKSKDWIYTFTQEWPVPKETHQFSYTIPVVHMTDPTNSSGIGDIALNYRYQAVLKDHIALAPRFSVILPTGDYKKGHGTDSVGLQANIPLSVELTDKFVTHWNFGATYTPSSREPGGAKADTTAFNYGVSLIYLATENFNLMLEAHCGAIPYNRQDRETIRSFILCQRPSHLDRLKKCPHVIGNRNRSASLTADIDMDEVPLCCDFLLILPEDTHFIAYT